MPKLFDEMLASRMKAVFDNHEVEYQPDDWENMRVKLGKKSGKKMFVMFPAIAKAASIILFLGLSVFYLNHNPENNQFSQLSLKKDSTKSDSISKLQNTSKNKSNDSEIQKSTTKHQQIRNDNKVIENNRNNIEHDQEITDLTTKYADDVILPVDSSKLMLAYIKEVLQNHRENIQKMTNKENNDSITKKILDLPEDENFITNNEKKNHFEFGVELASISNYSPDGNGSNLNIGGGFSAGYNISKKFGLETGMSISKQSMEYKNTDVLNNSKSNMQFASNNSLNVIDRNSAKSNISFVTIDIPLNARYKIKKFIFTAGVSSLIFVNEKYSYNYNATVTNATYNVITANYDIVSNTQNFSEDQSSEMFNHVDFAGLFNLSVAYDMPLPKGSIAFEPYVKLPLGNVSSYNVTIGSGGIALRYNF
jgi:hypothetical protein